MIRKVFCPRCGRGTWSYPTLGTFLCEACREGHDPSCAAWQRWSGQACTCGLDGKDGG